jgi:putative protease
MAVRKKAKVKRKKAPARRPATRKKAKARKKPVRKAPARRAAPKTRKPAARPAARPAQPPPPGERIGVVTHYFSHLSVAVLKLDAGARLRVGDTIHIRGHTTDFSQRVDSLQVEHAAVTEVGPDDDFGLKVREHAREHDVVYKVS